MSDQRAALQALLTRAAACLHDWVTQEGWTDATVAYQVNLSAELANELDEVALDIAESPRLLDPQKEEKESTKP